MSSVSLIQSCQLSLQTVAMRIVGTQKQRKGYILRAPAVFCFCMLQKNEPDHTACLEVVENSLTGRLAARSIASGCWSFLLAIALPLLRLASALGVLPTLAHQCCQFGLKHARLRAQFSPSLSPSAPEWVPNQNMARVSSMLWLLALRRLLRHPPEPWDGSLPSAPGTVERGVNAKRQDPKSPWFWRTPHGASHPTQECDRLLLHGTCRKAPSFPAPQIDIHGSEKKNCLTKAQVYRRQDSHTHTQRAFMVSDHKLPGGSAETSPILFPMLVPLKWLRLRNFMASWKGSAVTSSICSNWLKVVLSRLT